MVRFLRQEWAFTVLITRCKMDHNEAIAYLTAPDGKIFQFLNEDGTDWNEQATYDELNAYLEGLSK